MKAPISTLLTLLVLSACSRTSVLELAPPKPSLEATPAVVPPPAISSEAEPYDMDFAGAEGAEKIPPVKYAAAAVFEGGSGIPEPTEDGAVQHQPKWRVTLCFEKTEQEKSESFEIDLASLGTAYMNPSSVEAKAKGEAYYTLDKVVLPYTYNARIRQYQGEQASGEVQAKTKDPVQTWTLHPALSGSTAAAPQQPADLKLFKLNWTWGTLVGDGALTFKDGGQPFYITRQLLMHEYNAADATVVNPVAICDQRDLPVIYEVLETSEAAQAAPAETVQPTTEKLFKAEDFLNLE